MLEFLRFGRVMRDNGRTSPKPFLYRREWDGAFCRTAAAEMWAAMREEIMASWVRERPGTRPWAWWTFTAPEDRPEGEPELAYLRRHNLLTAGEREEKQ
ncbi:MAG: hypothetical protein AB1916_03040 [Thermodesulfobacteriota bacterium]